MLKLDTLPSAQALRDKQAQLRRDAREETDPARKSAYVTASDCYWSAEQAIERGDEVTAVRWLESAERALNLAAQAA